MSFEAAHIRWLTFFAKMIRKRWDRIINRSTYHVSSGRIEGLNAWIKNRRRMSFGLSSFDYFTLLIWEHTYPLIPRRIPSTNNYNSSKRKRRIPKHVRLPEPTIFRLPRDFKGN
ncbi:MAG: transposase [Spirochaetaceae bacterium]|nr:transposase [Spirochaetaceae bacterium]